MMITPVSVSSLSYSLDVSAELLWSERYVQSDCGQKCLVCSELSKVLGAEPGQ